MFVRTKVEAGGIGGVVRVWLSHSLEMLPRGWNGDCNCDSNELCGDYLVNLAASNEVKVGD